MNCKTLQIASIVGSVLIAILGLGALLLTVSASPPSISSRLFVEIENLATLSNGSIGDSENWENAGLYGGTVILAAYDPLEDDIYLAVSGAYYRSTDAAHTWTKVTDQGGNGCVAVDPVSGTVYLGVYEDIWISNDSGATWDVNTGLVGNANTMALDPQDGQTAFIGTGGENVNVHLNGYVHRTLDGGVTWTTVGVDPGYCISSLAVDPNDGGRVWAVSGPCGGFPDHTAVYSSTDRGVSFSLVLTSSYGYEFSQVAFGPSGVLYLVGDGVRVSHNSGMTFTTPVLTGTIGLNFYPMAINPTTGHAHVSTNLGGYYSDDGGLSWNWDGLPVLYGIDPENPLSMLGHSGQGLRRSTDGGVTWEDANTGIKQVIISQVSGNPEYPETIYVSTHRGFARSFDGGNSWQFPILERSTHGLAVSPITSSVLYVGEDQGARIHRSTDSGDNWQASTITSSNAFVRSVAVDPISPTTIYAGLSSHSHDPSADTSRDGLFVSTDGGGTWELAGLLGEQVNAVVAVTDTSGTVVYAGVGDQTDPSSTGGVYRRRAGESDWTQAGMADAIVNTIAVDPRDSDHVYCGVGVYGPGQVVQGFYESNDAGDHWSKVALGPHDAPVWSILFDPVDPDIVYVGVGNSLYRSLDGGASWLLDTQTESDGFSSLYVSPLAYPTIFAGMGDGVYRRSEGTQATVGTAGSSTMSYTNTQGTRITIDIPAGAVAQTTTFYLHNADIVTHTPTSLNFVGSIFLLNAVQDGARVNGFTPQLPITVTLHYTDDVGLDESSLLLQTWDSGQWVDAATTCTPASTYDRHPDENWLAVPICHLSEFALLGRRYPVFLPLVLKG